MNDLIYRLAAIKTIDEMLSLLPYDPLKSDYTQGITIGLSLAESRIKRLPPAQQELPFEIQNILEYLDTTLHPIISPEHWNVYSELHDMISTLPSEQPERAMGKWIDTDNYYQRWKCSVCGCHTRDAKPPYCPNCGKKMEGSND